MRNYSSMTEVLTDLSMDGSAQVGPKPGFFDISKSDKELKSYGRPAIPGDYKNMLKTVNGFRWKGIQFFGTESIGSPVGSLRGFNAYLMMSAYDLGNLLVIGQCEGQGTFYVYDAGSGRYMSVDGKSLAPKEQFGGLNDMITKVFSRV